MPNLKFAGHKGSAPHAVKLSEVPHFGLREFHQAVVFELPFFSIERYG
jgi:hypothetical protein